MSKLVNAMASDKERETVCLLAKYHCADNGVRDDSRDSFSIFTPVCLSVMRASP